MSVALDSAGSVSLGRGSDSASGSLGLSVNDVTIIGVGRDGNGASSATESSSAPDRVAGQSAASGSLGALGSGGAGNGSADERANVTTLRSAECASSPGGQRQFIGALTSGQEIWMRAGNCAADNIETADLAAQYPQLEKAVSAAGQRFQDVVAITISNDFVIIDMSMHR